MVLERVDLAGAVAVDFGLGQVIEREDCLLSTGVKMGRADVQSALPETCLSTTRPPGPKSSLELDLAPPSIRYLSRHLLMNFFSLPPRPAFRKTST